MSKGMSSATSAIREEPMTKNLQVSLSHDEAEILIDALEVDLEGYLDAAKEARGNNNRADVATFTEAAERIQNMIKKLQALLD